MHYNISYSGEFTTSDPSKFSRRCHIWHPGPPNQNHDMNIFVFGDLDFFGVFGCESVGQASKDKHFSAHFWWNFQKFKFSSHNSQSISSTSKTLQKLKNHKIAGHGKSAERWPQDHHTGSTSTIHNPHSTNLWDNNISATIGDIPAGLGAKTGGVPNLAPP